MDQFCRFFVDLFSCCAPVSRRSDDPPPTTQDEELRGNHGSPQQDMAPRKFEARNASNDEPAAAEAQRAVDETVATKTAGEAKTSTSNARVQGSVEEDIPTTNACLQEDAERRPTEKEKTDVSGEIGEATTVGSEVGL